jgi:GDP-L-fucose synthase
MQLCPDARIFVAGHTGLVGGAIWRELKRRAIKTLITRTRANLTF